MGAKCVKKQLKLVMFEWLHICNDVDNEKMQKKPLEFFMDAQDIRAQGIET